MLEACGLTAWRVSDCYSYFTYETIKDQDQNPDLSDHKVCVLYANSHRTLPVSPSDPRRALGSKCSGLCPHFQTLALLEGTGAIWIRLMKPTGIEKSVSTAFACNHFNCCRHPPCTGGSQECPLAWPQQEKAWAKSLVTSACKCFGCWERENEPFPHGALENQEHDGMYPRWHINQCSNSSTIFKKWNRQWDSERKIKIHQGPEKVLPVPTVNRKGSHKNEKSEESKF